MDSRTHCRHLKIAKKQERIMDLPLKRPLPPNRSYEQIKNHYLVEKEIAARLKRANRAERKEIYASMYDELFSKVLDHPRLSIQIDVTYITKKIRDRYEFIRRFIDNSTIFLEFAPGDCRFSIEMTRHVGFVYGIDISDQRSQIEEPPKNFKYVMYDGYDLHGVIDYDSIDLVFSDQLIEHFHPEDTKLHFSLAYHLLRKGKKYIFYTPHYLTGPSDISMYFSDEPEGFHLKEWTHVELRKLLKEVGFSDISGYIKIKGFRVRMPYLYFELWERGLSLFPKAKMRGLAQKVIQTILIVATK